MRGSGQDGHKQGGSPSKSHFLEGLKHFRVFHFIPPPRFSSCSWLPDGLRDTFGSASQLNPAGLCLQMQPLAAHQPRAPGKTCAKHHGEKEERFIPLHRRPRTRPQVPEAAAAPAPARRQRQGRSEPKQPEPSALRLCSAAPGTFGNAHKAKGTALVLYLNIRKHLEASRPGR